MTVSVDATGTKSYFTSSTSVNYTGLTVGSGSNRALVVSLEFDTNGTVSGISATWDNGGTNQSMTQLAFIDNGGTRPSALFGLVNPTSGNKTLHVSWTTATPVFVVGMSFAGVVQTSAATAFPHQATNTNVATVSVTSATGNMVMGSAATGGSLAGITGTTIYSDNTSGSIINAFANYDNGAASVTIGEGSSVDTIVATDIAAATGGGGFTPVFRKTLSSIGTRIGSRQTRVS